MRRVDDRRDDPREKIIIELKTIARFIACYIARMYVSRTHYFARQNSCSLRYEIIATTVGYNNNIKINRGITIHKGNSDKKRQKLIAQIQTINENHPLTLCNVARYFQVFYFRLARRCVYLIIKLLSNLIRSCNLHALNSQFSF